MSTLIPKNADKTFHVKRQGDKPAVEETITRKAVQPLVITSKQRPKGCETHLFRADLPTVLLDRGMESRIGVLAIRDENQHDRRMVALVSVGGALVSRYSELFLFVDTGNSNLRSLSGQVVVF